MSGTVFHLLRHEEEENFKSALERKVFKSEPECQRAALSCYVDLEAAKRHLGFQPAVFRGIARADLEPKHGVIRHTPRPKIPEHHSIWLRSEYHVQCSRLFVEMAR